MASKELIKAKFLKFADESDGEDREYFLKMADKCELIPVEEFDKINQGDARNLVESYKIKKTIKTRKAKKAYYALIAKCDRVTEKAIGFVTGTNHLHGSGYREYVEWIADSLIIRQDEKEYIPAWIIAEKGLWDFVNKKDKITA